MSGKKNSIVNEYVARTPEDRHERLEALRDLILEAAPDIIETIGYGEPSYRLHESLLVYFTNESDHISFSMGREMKDIEVDMTEGFVRSRSGFQIKMDRPFPADLIRELVAMKVKEIETALKRERIATMMRRNDREVKGRDGIEEIILQCKTCHVAMVADGVPYVIPMSFGYRFIDYYILELYFHSAYEGRKIDILKKNKRVCYEVANEGMPASADTPCNSGYYFSSLIGYGDVVFVQDPDEKCDALSVMFRHQTGKDIAFTHAQAETVCVFKIVSMDYTGKRKPKPA